MIGWFFRGVGVGAHSVDGRSTELRILGGRSQWSLADGDSESGGAGWQDPWVTRGDQWGRRRRSSWFARSKRTRNFLRERLSSACGGGPSENNDGVFGFRLALVEQHWKKYTRCGSRECARQYERRTTKQRNTNKPRVANFLARRQS